MVAAAAPWFICAPPTGWRALRIITPRLSVWVCSYTGRRWRRLRGDGVVHPASARAAQLARPGSLRHAGGWRWLRTGGQAAASERTGNTHTLSFSLSLSLSLSLLRSCCSWAGGQALLQLLPPLRRLVLIRASRAPFFPSSDRPQVWLIWGDGSAGCAAVASFFWRGRFD
eukprot:COSAG01_NODE_8414_length_2791_cov_2.495171_3_plen_170_part_00